MARRINKVKKVCHGAPLGDDEIALTREQLGWSHPAFTVPEDIYTAWNAAEKGDSLETAWDELFVRFCEAHPELADEFSRRMAGNLPENFSEKVEGFIETLDADKDNIASRKASQNSIEFLGKILPEFMGGSADLAGSNLTKWSGTQPLAANDFSGNYIYYGVREFAMAAIMNGISLYGGFLPYGGTFLIFSDYARNAIRMAALMKQRVIYVLTHDSIGLGEDGPTHQPIEQVATLRLIPNLAVWRPCDTVETAVAWQVAVESAAQPSALCLSRQNLPCQTRDAAQLQNIRRGAYVLQDCESQAELILLASGSEVELAVAAANQLSEKGKHVRVVSAPCLDIFDEQDDDYKQSVLPRAVTCRIAIEASSGDGWYKYVGLNGDVVAMQTFGESAPAADLFKHFGFTVENIVSRAESLC